MSSSEEEWIQIRMHRDAVDRSKLGNENAKIVYSEKLNHKKGF